MWEWLEIQWARFNMWLDLVERNPRRRYTVKHVGGGRFVVGERPKDEKEREVMLKEREEASELVRRRRELMTPEQRRAMEEKADRRYKELKGEE